MQLAAILLADRTDSPAAPDHWEPQQNALSRLHALTMDQPIRFTVEREPRDRYGRHSGHVMLGGWPESNVSSNSSATSAGGLVTERWLQYRLVAEGHARPSLSPETPNTCAKILLQAEADAARNRRGLWRDPAYSVRNADERFGLLRYRSTYQVVMGRVAKVEQRRTATYLNFGQDWRRDFTVRIPRKELHRWKLPRGALDALMGQPIRVRGWIERRNGPLITVWRAEQIEILKTDGADASDQAASARALGQRTDPISLLSHLQTGRPDSPEARRHRQ